MISSRRVLVALVLAAIPAVADERLAGIACRSVHLQYPAPAGNSFVSAVVVERSAPGTYFCVCGFDRGYFGLQELSDGKKVLIFSVWDPGPQDDPNSVPEDRRVKLVAKDEQIRTGRFGNEGTGGQSFLDYDWKVGEPYRFLVTARPAGARTEFAAYFAPPQAERWRHLVTFSTLADKPSLGGYYSFVEDFRRDRVSATRERRARFGNGWVRSTDGRWAALTRARFTADHNPALNIDAGARGEWFYLATGGDVANRGTPLGHELDRLPAGVLAPP